MANLKDLCEIFVSLGFFRPHYNLIVHLISVDGKSASVNRRTTNSEWNSAGKRYRFTDAALSQSYTKGRPANVDFQWQAIGKIEGLSADGEHPVQKAWRQVSVPQCGFCQAGQIMQAASLLSKNRAPTDAQIVEEMQGNLCRCGCYQRIHEAVRLAAGGV